MTLKPMRLFLTAAALAMIGGCALPIGKAPTSPSELSERTALDERAALGVELAYSAARTAVELGVDAGLIRGDLARRVSDADHRAYQAVLAARAAYDAGNAQSYEAALVRARAAVSEVVTLIKGASK